MKKKGLSRREIIQTIIGAAAVGGHGGQAFAGSRVAVGALRWDAWYDGSPFSSVLASPKWQDRIPSFSTLHSGKLCICGSDPANLRIEIGLAKFFGVDYFAFDYYYPFDWRGEYNSKYEAIGQSLRSFTSISQNDVKFSLNFALSMAAGLGEVHSPRLIAQQIRYMSSTAYLKTGDGRPVLFVMVFDHRRFEPTGDLKGHALAYIGRLREAAKQAKLGEPYLIALAFSPADGAYFVSSMGFNAISSYGNPRGFPELGAGRSLPFANCSAGSRFYWTQADVVQVPYLPPISLGWDYRPVLDDPEQAKTRKANGDWCEPPRPQEISSLVTDAYVKAFSTNADFPSCLIYAWNEYTEGGWIAPTRGYGTERLVAVKEGIERGLSKLPRSHN